MSRLRHISARAFTDEVVYEPWHDMACMYFFCESDQALLLPVQQQFAKGLGENIVTYTTVGSHSPFFSQIQDVVDGLEFAARVGREREVAT